MVSVDRESDEADNYRADIRMKDHYRSILFSTFQEMKCAIDFILKSQGLTNQRFG